MRELTVFLDEGAIDMDTIEAFEKDIDACFPENYKQLISKYNNLYAKENTFDFVNVYNE